MGDAPNVSKFSSTSEIKTQEPQATNCNASFMHKCAESQCKQMLTNMNIYGNIEFNFSATNINISSEVQLITEQTDIGNCVNAFHDFCHIQSGCLLLHEINILLSSGKDIEICFFQRKTKSCAPVFSKDGTKLQVFINIDEFAPKQTSAKCHIFPQSHNSKSKINCQYCNGDYRFGRGQNAET
jgi:hypothetical protein